MEGVKGKLSDSPEFKLSARCAEPVLSTLGGPVLRRGSSFGDGNEQQGGRLGVA